MLAVIAVSVVAIIAAGCGSSGPSGPSGPSARSSPATETIASLADKYLAIAKIGNDGLEKSLDDLAKVDLATAQHNLRAAAQVEHQFDHSLAAITFPPPIEATARALVTANESRATLTTTVAASTTSSQLKQGEQQLDAANAAVEVQVRTIRAQLGLPPPATS